MMSQTEIFEANRPGLMSLGYRMLGEVAGAEDIVQETWLRWSSADQETIANPAAWLRRTATNIAIDTLRSARARREDYVGPWLPEPIIDDGGDTPDSRLEIAQECELALLWAMENLSEVERAAFILREAFDAGYDEIALALGKSQAACRQLVSRSHKRLNESGPRFDADEEAVSDLISRFVAATMAKDRQSVLDLMSERAMAVTDGGGKVSAALRPLRGPEDIIQVFFHLADRERDKAEMVFKTGKANGVPAIFRYLAGELDTVFTLASDAQGKIAWIYVMRNPDKLGG